MASAAFEGMEEHWLLEYINFDAFDSLENHFGPPSSEADSQAATASTTNDSAADTIADGTTGSATEYTADNISTDTSYSEGVVAQASTGEEVAVRASSAFEAESLVATGPEKNGLAGNDAKMSLQGIGPPAPNQLEEVLKAEQPRDDDLMGLEALQPRAPNDYEMGLQDFQRLPPSHVEGAPNVDQPGVLNRVAKRRQVSKGVKKAARVDQTRAPSHVGAHAAFAQFEAVPKAETPFGASKSDFINMPLYPSQPWMQTAGIPAGGFGRGPVNHQTGLQFPHPMQNAGIPLGTSSFGMANHHTDFHVGGFGSDLADHMSLRESLQASSFQSPDFENFGLFGGAQGKRMPAGAFNFDLINNFSPQPGSEANLQPNFHANYQSDFPRNYQSGFAPNHQADFQAHYQSGFHPNYQPGFQMNHQPGFQAYYQPGFQANFQSAPGRPSSRQKPFLAGGKALPKAINPNFKSSIAQGKRKVSGEEVKPRRVTAGKGAVKKMPKKAKALPPTKPGEYLLTGEIVNRSYEGESMISHWCSDGCLRILTDDLLEQAQARTEVAKAKQVCIEDAEAERANDED